MRHGRHVVCLLSAKEDLSLLDAVKLRGVPQKITTLLRVSFGLYILCLVIYLLIKSIIKAHALLETLFSFCSLTISRGLCSFIPTPFSTTAAWLGCSTPSSSLCHPFPHFSRFASIISLYWSIFVNLSILIRSQAP